jgi:aminomethyltransferase
MMKETPLTAWHRRHGAKMAEFAGYWMPMEYTGILDEHRYVRAHVGVFDVSHMAEFRVAGVEAARFLDRLVTNRPSQLEMGQALYTPMCYPDGGTVDDLLVYRLGPNEFWLVTNAANRDSDAAWMNEVRAAYPAVTVRDESDEVALIAVQGPEAARLLGRLTTGAALSAVPSYHFVRDVHVAGRPVWLVSRTGYTGEDGFEVYLSAEAAEPVWDALVEAGARPAGLGARDTLRLEARLPLYGHELSPTITPIEAGLGPFIKWDKPDGFVGQEALAALRARGPARRLAGLYVEEGIARAGAAVGREGVEGETGVVTSGTFSPTLNRAVALALVPAAWATPGERLWVAVRGRRLPATVVKLPFYRRSEGASR